MRLSFLLALVTAFCAIPAVAAGMEQEVRAGIANAKPMLDALDRYKAATGRYPQYVENLMPAYFAMRPRPSADSVFLYAGEEQTFQLSFLLGPSPAQHMVVYRPARDYAARINDGPYYWSLTGTVESWGQYRLGKQQTVAIQRQWNGRIPAGAPPAPAMIVDGETLKKTWQAWQIPGSAPGVDFSRELMLTNVAQSSLTRCTGAYLDDKGDLQPQIVATPDQPGFSSYALCLLPRAGVKSVRGQALR